VLVDGFQHEQPDYWLTFGNPWELERSASIAYPISYYGHVSVHEEGGRQIFRWNPGETVRALCLCLCCACCECCVLRGRAPGLPAGPRRDTCARWPRSGSAGQCAVRLAPPCSA
jgi:hypothetical protein